MNINNALINLEVNSGPKMMFHPDDVAGCSSAPGSKQLHQNPTKRRRSVSVLKPKSQPTTKRRKTTTKTTTTSLKNDTCTECGKKFLSSKALYGHMRCHPERHWRGINPPNPNTNLPCSSVTDEYEIATCLLLLARGERTNDVVACESEGVFECSSCGKVFRSHQALGGHRATHKSIKGCFAMAAQSSGPIEVSDWAIVLSSSAHVHDFDLNLPADHLDLRLGL